MKYLFEPTEGKVEYLDKKYVAIQRAHEHKTDVIDYIGSIKLENGMFINYLKCFECDARFIDFGQDCPGDCGCT